MSSAKRLKIEVHHSGSTTVVSLSGAAGSVEAEMLEKALRNVTERRPKLAIIDLAGCEMLCTLAMGALIYMYRAMQKNGGSMRLAGPPPMVLRSLKHACLHEVFGIFDSVESAMDPASGNPWP